MRNRHWFVARRRWNGSLRYICLQGLLYCLCRQLLLGLRINSNHRLGRGRQHRGRGW